jgi:hypothetical protein
MDLLGRKKEGRWAQRDELLEGWFGCLGFRSGKEHAQQREVREQASTALVAVVVY